MATLVFTAVGQALGGPVGAALGSVVGRSIDESLFGPGPRRGPRLGDLSAQTSTYGSMIPRVYGTMRVAGTVVWATDLIEEETVEGGSKGSAPTQGYKYSVSLAVALSSRPATSVGRIWADGKLIRGVDGDFKVRTGFRLFDGSEDQAIDPLIASEESIDLTPAYRGVALAVFEGLELREFGNRIPQLTFEVSADEAPVALSAIAADCSLGLIGVTKGGAAVGGYAAYGQSRLDALATLVGVAGIELTDDGNRLTLVGDEPPVIIEDAELGCSPDGTAPKVERHRDAGGVAAALAMTYYDVARDFQTGQARVSAGTGGLRDERVELAAALDAESAKGFAERLLAERRADADTITMRLPPTRMGLVPGQLLTVPGQGRWQARAVSVEEMAVVVEARRPRAPHALLPADGGRSAEQPDLPIGRTELAIIETPPLPGISGPFVVGSNAGLWKTVPVEIAINGVITGAMALPRAARLGSTLNAIGDGSSSIIDRQSGLIVKLVDQGQSLFNVDAEALNAGANAAMVGDELIQFGRAEPLGGGRWLLSHLFRGCRGTEWAASGHEVGETFCLLGTGLEAISAGSLVEDCEIRATAGGIGDILPLPSTTRNYEAEQLRPPSPCRLEAEMDGSDLRVSWEGRSWAGFDWPSGVDAVVADFVVFVGTAAGQVQRQTDERWLAIPVVDVPGSGPRVAVVKVATSVDSRLSRFATTQIEI